MFKNEGSIIAGILIIGVLGFLCSPIEAAVRIEGQSKRAVARLPIPSSRFGPRAVINRGN